MSYTNVRIKCLSDEEIAKINRLVDKLREERKYSSKPDLYHRLLMKGCDDFLTDEKE